MAATLGSVVEERHSEDPSLRGRWRLCVEMFWSERHTTAANKLQDWIRGADADVEVVQVSVIPETPDSWDGILLLYREREGNGAHA